MRITRAERGLWVDTPARLTKEDCTWLKAHGVVGVVRYIARWRTSPDTDAPIYGGWFWVLSRSEVAAILASGLELSVVQAAKTTGRPYLNYQYGLELGEAAAANCARLELPTGITVWWDAEWSDGPSSKQVLACGNGWGVPVTSRGDRPGTYVGYDGVDGPGWYSLPQCYHYWGSAMAVQSPQPQAPADADLETIKRWLSHEPRGWQLRQGLETRLPVPGHRGGLDVDCNIASTDDRGERFFVLSK